jgi:class 3 adenylate cyclase
LRRYNLEAQTLRQATEAERAYGAEQARVKAERVQMAHQIETQFRENAALSEANRKIDGLLLNLLPSPVVSELKATGASVPREFSRVGVLVGDIVGFSTVSKTLAPADLFAELNELFGTFDGFLAEAGAQRLKTIGDAYMAVAGILDGVEDPARVLVGVAQRALAHLDARASGAFRTMRWGLAVGPVMAGIVGQSRYIYDVFGHTVNLAFRLEAASAPGHLCVDGPTAAASGLIFSPAGTKDLKGVGPVTLHLLGPSSNSHEI